MVPDSGTIPRISDSLDFAGLAEKSCLRFTSSHGAPLLLHPSDADLLHALQPQYRLPAIARRRARSAPLWDLARSEEHTSELQSLMRISYAVFCLKKQIKYSK